MCVRLWRCVHLNVLKVLSCASPGFSLKHNTGYKISKHTQSHALDTGFTFTPLTYSPTHLAQMSLLSCRHGKNYPSVNFKITMCVTGALV